MTSAAEQLIVAGQPREALALLQQQVREHPEDPVRRYDHRDRPGIGQHG